MHTAPFDFPPPVTYPARHVLLVCLAAFVCYLTIAIPLPVIPIFVRFTLGFPDWVVGVAVGSQFLATLATRRYAGGISDSSGGHVAVHRGLAACSVAGLAYLVAAWVPAGPLPRLLILLGGRVILGFGESLLLTGVLAWSVGLSGPARSGRAISWLGMAIYGSLAVGSPIGLWLLNTYGFAAMAVVVALIPLLGSAAIVVVPKVQPHVGEPVPFRHVVGRIWRPGVALGLQGMGFAAIGAFVSLYFTAEQWDWAGLALSAFGGMFVLARILFGNLPDRLGGARVALRFFVVEAAGQLVLALASNATMALIGAALTGFGCSMIFPSLGVETVRLVPAKSRGTALGAFAAFQDVAYGLTGPVAGLVAGMYGYASVFFIGTGAAVLGLFMTLPLLPRKTDVRQGETS